MDHDLDGLVLAREVFPVRDDPECGCCPWTAADWQEVDFDGYSSADDAMRGHMAMCEKWAVRT